MFHGGEENRKIKLAEKMIQVAKKKTYEERGAKMSEVEDKWGQYFYYFRVGAI